jgi:chemotaxis protein methyltransferase CheR
MESTTLRMFCELAYAKAGIALNASKEPLLAARLAKRLRALGLSSEKEYLKVLSGADGERELVNFLDAISTNFTSFFREEQHFQTLAATVSAWVSEGRRKLRFWSCAASTGEEPYSMAIVVQDAIGSAPVDFRILATDISTRVLSVARQGVYGKAQVERVPSKLRTGSFSTVAKPDGSVGYAICSALRDRVAFARLNLSTPPFPMQGPIDAVLCRNVMIYFDQRVRQELVREIERVLAPGGYLMIGHSETLNGVATRLRPVEVSIYRKLQPGEATRGWSVVPPGRGPGPLLVARGPSPWRS